MRIGVRCDAGPATGVGHLVRCVALAEELTRRGAMVRFLTDVGGLPWAQRQLDARGLTRQPAPRAPGELAAAARALALDAVILDSYELSPDHATALRADGRVVLAVVDGDLRGQVADMYVDQNLDAELVAVAVPAGSVRLAGLRYALLRDAVRRLRPDRPRTTAAGRAPRVVCFFGGTDAYRAAPVLARILVETREPCDVVVVAADDAIRADLAAIEPVHGQVLTAIEPTDELPRLLADADLAISASGTSTWELLCLGLPAALVWVADNQLLGYRRTLDRGMAVGLGRLGDLTAPGTAASEATTALRDLLRDAGMRADLAGRGWGAVDGRGVERVADELLRRVRERAGAPSSGRPAR